MKNCNLIVTDVSDKTVKNWNRMKNAAELRGIYLCEDYACMLYMYEISREIFHKV